MKNVVPFSALYLAPRRSQPAPTEKTTLLDWTIEDDPTYPNGDPLINFNEPSGEYVVPIDGQYLLVVQLIPTNYFYLSSKARMRSHVDYAIRLNLPPDHEPTPDAIQASYLDVGSRNFGELIHFKAQTRIACVQMQGAPGWANVRLKVELVQRKRKRFVPQLTRKEIKSRRKEKRRADAERAASNPSKSSSDQCDSDDDSDDSDDSEWETGFESDSTSEDLPNSNKVVGRSAKRFKSGAAQSNWDA